MLTWNLYWRLASYVKFRNVDKKWVDLSAIHHFCQMITCTKKSKYRTYQKLNLINNWYIKIVWQQVYRKIKRLIWHLFQGFWKNQSFPIISRGPISRFQAIQGFQGFFKVVATLLLYIQNPAFPTKIKKWKIKVKWNKNIMENLDTLY